MLIEGQRSDKKRLKAKFHLTETKLAIEINAALTLILLNVYG